MIPPLCSDLRRLGSDQAPNAGACTGKIVLHNLELSSNFVELGR